MAMGDCFGTSKKALKERVRAQESALQQQQAEANRRLLHDAMAPRTSLPPAQDLTRSAHLNPVVAAAMATHTTAHQSNIATAGGSSLIQITQPPPEVTIRQHPPQVNVLAQQTPAAYQVSVPATSHTAHVMNEPVSHMTALPQVTHLATAPQTTSFPAQMTYLPQMHAPPVHFATAAMPVQLNAAPLSFSAAPMMVSASPVVMQPAAASYMLHQGMVSPSSGSVSVRSGCPLGRLYNGTSEALLASGAPHGGGMSAHIHHHHHVCRRHR
eukprot:Gregarina_sp_Pseudo_9__5146@NODE_544_length_2600_cov_34_446701_g514_i0_p2_GENE_NODE_544_length_2600_cov_34_446701_g514_i0NODE_544_length_2600_cov_34_446701_g514_i0_p2_ORF_typecomplete_len269_score33_01CRF/PF00473_17/0_22CRF/PF00473_17/8_9e03_NODE_544_length_2600_cov_34_446701_g514_i016772483